MTAAIRVEGLSKSFNGVRVLDDVSSEIGPGEVHGLLGANGSGKSTLIKILAGFHSADGGAVWIDGRRHAAPFGPTGLADHGIAFVHQDLALAPGATVLEHFALESIGRRWGSGRVDWAEVSRSARRLLERCEVDAPLDATIDTLSPVQRAMVAIVRAISRHERFAENGGGAASRLLVLDEPTVFLPRHEISVLLGLIDRLRRDGDSVLLVSHDLDEVRSVCDRVTVLRNGKVVGSRAVDEVGRAELVELILGAPEKRPGRPGPAASDRGEDVVVRARGLAGDFVEGVDVDCRRGEVLGVTGLAGSGYEELAELIYGAVARRAGTIEVSGQTVPEPTPATMLDRGVILVPADRKRHGGALGLSILENLSLPLLTSTARGWWLPWRSLRERAHQTCETVRVVPPDPDLALGDLSGGNQQKVVLGKWLNVEPSLMLLAEPTQGVDIGARREIFALIRAAVADGMSVLCATSDYEQLVELADRVIVMRSGRVSHELTGDDITDESLAAAVYAGEAA